MLLPTLLMIARSGPALPSVPDPEPVLRALAPRLRDTSMTEVGVSAALAPAQRTRVRQSLARLLGVRAVRSGRLTRLPSCPWARLEEAGQPPPGVRLTVTRFSVTGARASVVVVMGCRRADGYVYEMERPWTLEYLGGRWQVIGDGGPVRQTARPDAQPGALTTRVARVSPNVALELTSAIW